MQSKFIIPVLLLLVLSSCKVEDIIGEFGSSKITAKDKVGEVVNKSKTEFAADAKLASIYGREVGTNGEVDLLQTNSISNFFYFVQSDSLQQNKIYIPVYKSSPVESPLDIQTALDLIKDDNVKANMNTILGTLSHLSIGSGVSYDDSPAVLNKMFVNSTVTDFRTNHPDNKIDMYLVPSKSIDSTFSSSADWIVNFYSESASLVMWLHTSSGVVQPLPGQ
jgi:hypothetical protein